MNTFKLKVLAAERTFYDGDCVSVVIPSISGQYGILAHHSNILGAMVPGTLKIVTADNEVIIAAVSEGIVKIENNEVFLLVSTAELPHEIDEIRAKQAAEDAKEAMLQKRSAQDYLAAQAKMARAIYRLKAKNHHSIKHI